MNPWYVGLIKISILAVMLICFIVLVVKLIKAQKYNNPIAKNIFMISADIVLFACSLIFILSHSTYYRYNDRVILNSDINSVMSKYGAFDRGEVQEGISGKVGYYIYTDNGPIMPDHMEHYYWIYYDESGKVFKVEDGLLAGG
ncbi:hypothetical protein [Ruminococcus albus]|uniref:Uncharacterized protein n=1 Tax=Ruminococcus albus TaxID=1264 RepID=A0A1H7M9K8_RUMAL|nr:hypothetical protein [Ruminococcus albus]SEL07801.1 hypothetical protein SAMN05216469_11129 [Ruminococcus albus]